MTVLVRDQVAADHLVYAWPFPIGPECEVSCSDDEQVVMCPAWMVGDRLGPGRHRWRTPDPSRPVTAFFVLTAPVEVSFDMVTSFVIPSTHQPVRLRASGSLQVRCADPGLLIAQFVGLPFDRINEGVLRSVSRSVERMLARLLTRRVVMAGSPIAVTDGGMLPGILEELIAYNPTAGAVFGVDLIRMGHLTVAADDGSSPYLPVPAPNLDWSGAHQRIPEPHYNGNGNGHASHAAVVPPPLTSTDHVPTPPRQYPRPKTPVLETVKGMPAVVPDAKEMPAERSTMRAGSVPPVDLDPPSDRPAVASGEIIPRKTTAPPGAMMSSASGSATSGEIGPRTPPPGALTSDMTKSASGEIGSKVTPPAAASSGPPATASGEITPKKPAGSERAKAMTTPGFVPLASPSAAPPMPPGAGSIPPGAPTPRAIPSVIGAPAPRRAAPIEVPKSVDEITQPGIDKRTMTPVPGSLSAPTSPPADAEQPRGAIMGIGMGAIGATSVSGEIPTKVPPGGRVLVPGPNGLMQSATVRQLLQGYYELEVGSSGQTIWVPINGVVPEN